MNGDPPAEKAVATELVAPADYDPDCSEALAVESGIPEGLRERFWELPLAALTAAEWEALCDGCGRCCLHKLEDEETGDLVYTVVACRLLDCETGRCRDYAHRQSLVPDCLNIDAISVTEFNWLPPTCAYRLCAAGEPLPDWHPLHSGDPASVRRAGVSVAGRVQPEDAVADRTWAEFVADWPGQWPRPIRARRKNPR